MDKFCLITKSLFQIILSLFETLGVSCILTLITNIFLPVTNWFDYIERITVYYALYQIIIYNFLQQLNDIKKDEYLAILTMYRYIEIYNSSKSMRIKEDIKSIINKQLDNGTLNDINIRKEYKEIRKVLNANKNFDDTLIKVNILKYEHLYEVSSLNWKYSIILRIFK